MGLQGQGFLIRFYTIPRGSYPTPFLGRLLFKITDPNPKTRYPKKGVGYEPLGKTQNKHASGSSPFFVGLINAAKEEVALGVGETAIGGFRVQDF